VSISSWNRTYKDHLVQLLHQFRAAQKFKRAIMGVVQTLLRHCQAWGTARLSRKPPPGFGHPLGKDSGYLEVG